MYKKKISTIAIVTILTLSIMLAAIPMATAAITGTPGIDIPNGPVGTKPTVTGTGVTGGASSFSTVTLYWNNLAGQVLGTTTADENGDWSKKVTIPEATNGPHFIVANDGTGAMGVSFDVEESIKASTTPSTADLTYDAKVLPGDSVSVTGTGFAGTTFMNEVDVRIFLGNYGSTTQTFTGDGTTVAFTLANKPVVVGETVTIDPITAETVTLVITGAPTYTGDLAVIPVKPNSLTLTVADSVPAYYVITDDGAGKLTSTDVTITASSINYATGAFSFTLGGTPPTLVAGATADYDQDVTYTINRTTGIITFSVAPYAATDNIVVVYEYADYEVTPIAGVTTDDLGSFSAAITIPAMAETAYGDYAVTVVDEDGNTDAALLRVHYYVTVTPPSGPTGITITIAGRIKANTAYELRFNVAAIAIGTSAADGSFSDTYLISAVLSPNTYPVAIFWETVKHADTTFTVNPTPTLVLGATSGVVGAVVTISGAGFSAGANITLIIGTTIVNSTQSDDRFGPTGSFGATAGKFSEEFTVPAITPGLYTLTVTDEYGASTGTVYTFQVLAAPVTTIALRASSYFQGDTLSFNIFTTDTITAGPTVTIRDPTGSTWWTATWTLTPVGPTASVRYQDQVDINNNPLTLPSDAPLGSWNWTITYTIGTAKKATGLFTVSALPTMQTVLDQLDTMEASIKSVVTTSEGKIIVAVNTKAGTIMTDLDPLMPKLQGIEDTAVIIATMLGEVQVDIAALDLAALDALGVDITSIKGDVATIKTNIGTVTTSVSALDAKVTTLSGDVATVSTSLGTLQGTVTSIDGKVATIDTSVGTLQADISDVSGKVDTTPAWIAVVLSLVAAIAAIFAVITIRQKIAG